MRATTIVALLLTTLLGVTATRADTSPPYTIGISSHALEAGAEGPVELRAIGGTQRVAAWTVDVGYDPAIVSVTACIAPEDGICDSESQDHVVRATGASVSGFAGDYTLATITFRCETPGRSSLSIQTSVFGSAIPEDPRVNFQEQDGSIYCRAQGASLPGDVNCNVAVESTDARLLLRFHAGLRASLPCPDAADPNNDRRIDSVDAALILQFDADLICEPFADACIRD